MKARCRERVTFRFAQRTPYDRWEVFERISYAYTIFYDFHLIIVRTTLIRRLRKTQTTSKKLKQPRRVVNSRETSSIDYTTPDIMQSDMKSNNLYMRKTNARLTNSLTMYEHYILYCTRQCSGFQPDENWGNLRTRNEIMWTRSQREEGARSERRSLCRERNLTANASRAVNPDV